MSYSVSDNAQFSELSDSNGFACMPLLCGICLKSLSVKYSYCADISR